jgi:hypothetical protein
VNVDDAVFGKDGEYECDGVSGIDLMKIWMLKQQSEENLPHGETTKFVRAERALALKTTIAALAKKRQGKRNDLANIMPDGAECSVSTTREILAQIAGCGKNYIDDVEQILSWTSQEADLPITVNGATAFLSEFLPKLRLSVRDGGVTLNAVKKAVQAAMTPAKAARVKPAQQAVQQSATTVSAVIQPQQLTSPNTALSPEITPEDEAAKRTKEIRERTNEINDWFEGLKNAITIYQNNEPTADAELEKLRSEVGDDVATVSRINAVDENIKKLRPEIGELVGEVFGKLNTFSALAEMGGENNE